MVDVPVLPGMFYGLPVQEMSPLFDLPEGRRRRDDGFSRLESSTPQAVTDAIWAVWRRACEAHLQLTIDEFWALCPLELRADLEGRGNTIGKMINESAQRGWVVDTGTTVKTKRPSSNARAVKLWRSRLHRSLEA
jgi:hypothetical protein